MLSTPTGSTRFEAMVRGVAPAFSIMLISRPSTGSAVAVIHTDYADDCKNQQPAKALEDAQISRPINMKKITTPPELRWTKDRVQQFRQRHGIRQVAHSFASHLVMRGVPLKAVQELLGHTDMKMTMRYAHLSPDVHRDAVAVLDQPVQRHPCSTEQKGALISLANSAKTIKKPGT
jgi:hypothetical protein